MMKKYGCLTTIYVLFFTGCAPGLMPMGPLMDSNSWVTTVLIVIIIFGIYLYSKKDKKQNESELSKRVKELEKDIRDIKDKI